MLLEDALDLGKGGSGHIGPLDVYNPDCLPERRLNAPVAT
jgi:hypothetical protein